MKHHVKASDVDAVLSELGAQQHGVFHLDQTVRRGLSYDALKHRRRVGRIVRLKRNIFRLPTTHGPGRRNSRRGCSMRRPARLSAIALRPNSMASGATGAVCHRSHGTGPPRSPRDLGSLSSVGVASATSAQGPGGLSGHNGRADVLRPLSAIPIQDYGLSPRLGRSRGPNVEGLNDALARRGLTLGQLAVVRASIGKRGRPGSALTRELLNKFGPSTSPTESDGESLLAELVEEFGWGHLSVRCRMSDEQGWIGTVDFVWQTSMLVLEIDSVWHDGPLDQQADADQRRSIERARPDVWRWRYGDLVMSTARFNPHNSDPASNFGRITGAMAPVSHPTFVAGVEVS